MPETEVKSLFSTPLWIVDLEQRLSMPMNMKLIKDILHLIEPRAALEPGTNWQTDPWVHELPAFREVSDFVLKTCKGVLSFLKIPGQ